MKATWLMNAQKAADERYERLTNWQPWFAWRPVWVARDDCRWLETVERKCEFVGAYDGTYTFCEYRAKPTEKEAEPTENLTE